MISRAKGIQRRTIAKHDEYRDVLNELYNEKRYAEQNKIVSKDRILFTSREDKVVLAPFDDKRHFINKTQTLPHGYFSLKHFY